MYKNLVSQCHRINRCLLAHSSPAFPLPAARQLQQLQSHHLHYSASSAAASSVLTLPNTIAAYTTSPDRKLAAQLVHSAHMATSSDATGGAEHTNRLAQEKSTYLLQHAHNPVDWFPWGDEAIALARSEQKLIFLSIGYSTCHWCHVMEKESFENAAIAAQMNRDFVCIKVDREERPDLDRIYMNFVVMVNGSGGWPMSVWLTPDLAPISAGTYFPPVDRWGTPGFPSVLAKVQQKWLQDRENVVRVGLRVIDVLGASSSCGREAEGGALPTDVALQTTEDKFEEAVRIYYRNVDPDWGGFGRSPKFPEVSKLQFVLHANTHKPDGELLSVALHTLRKIAEGGIHDHVFGGFARYSVDRKWHVPHFEKMLYDQGQLMQAYASAYKITGRALYAEVADDIFRYVCKDLQHVEGGFYSGEDADSLPEMGDADKIEGAFYAWEWQELRDVYEANKAQFELPTAFDLFVAYFGVEEDGNVGADSDPHGHLLTKNILMVQMSEEKAAETFGCDVAAVRRVLDTFRELLHAVREKRPRPHLDTKIITAWNGLMLSGLAKLATIGGGGDGGAGGVVDEAKRAEYAAVAGRLVAFLKETVYDAETKKLYRTCYGTGVGSAEKATISTPIDGFLDDYAFLIKGLLDYYLVCGDVAVLRWARELQHTQDRLFWDPEHHAYFYSQANAANVVVRLKDDHDGAEPCGNSVATGNLMLLHSYFNADEFRANAAKVFAYFARTSPFGFMLPEMLSAMLLHETGVCQVVVVGAASDQLVQQFLAATRSYYVPGLTLITVDPAAADECVNPAVKDYKLVDGRPAVYICHKQVCLAPITELAELRTKLNEKYRFAEV